VLIHQLLSIDKFGKAQNDNRPDAKDSGVEISLSLKKTPLFFNNLFAVCELNEGQFHALSRVSLI